MAKDTLIKVDKNGTKYWANYTCPRCGGAGGSDAWAYTGWTCYECGGSGIAPKPSIWKEYTEEYAAKLAEQRAKREQKRIAKLKEELPQTKQKWYDRNNFNAQGETFLFLGNTFEMKEDIKAVGGTYHGYLGWHIDHEVEGFQFLKVTADEVADEVLVGGYDLSREKCDSLESRRQDEYNRLNGISDSGYVGQVGDKLNTELTLAKINSWEQESYRGWGTEMMYLYTFKDENNNLLIWKTTSFQELEAGARVYLKGTIKEHSEYKGTKQTVLTRCRVEEVKTNEITD